MEAAGWQIHPLGGEFPQAGILAAETAEREIQSAGPSGGRPMTARQAEAKERGDWAKAYSGF